MTKRKALVKKDVSVLIKKGDYLYENNEGDFVKKPYTKREQVELKVKEFYPVLKKEVENTYKALKDYYKLI